ncbi:MAG: DUF2259 domain-containing protein [Treponemataceae bacterium]
MKIKKIISITLLSIFTLAVLFAGDVANLVSLGFSNDGMTYAFGEYGMQDKTYRSYANIFVVDVAKNEYIKNGVFRTSPSTLTANKESKSVFLALQNRAEYTLSKNKISSKNDGRPIYAQSEKTKNHTNLYFRDFQTNYEYNVVLNKSKKGMDTAFYISFDVTLPDGSKKSYTVGAKNYFRSGVKDVNIKRVLINNQNTGLVFVIEKTEQDSSGDCIRYMIETVKL